MDKLSGGTKKTVRYNGVFALAGDRRAGFDCTVHEF